MLSQISKKIARWCYTGTGSGDLEITSYGIELLLDTLSKLIALLLFAAFIGSLPEMVIVLLTFSSLRYFAGGFHMQSNLGCFLSMVFIAGLSLAVQKLAFFYQLAFPRIGLVVVLFVLVALVFLYAPAATRNNPIKDQKTVKKKKLYAVILSVFISFVIFYIPDNIKFLLLVPFICEVITILPIVNYKTTREEGYRCGKKKTNHC